MRHIIAVLTALTALPVMAEDSCHVPLPETLRAQVTEHFPSFRLPVATDNLPDDVKWSKELEGNDCLGIATADFDGDNTKDWLLGLTAKEDSGALIAVALARGEKWELHKLNAWPEGRSRLYVSSDGPGTYESLFDGPYEPGEVASFVCQHSVAVFGAVESSGVAYCYTDGKWLHTWISD